METLKRNMVNLGKGLAVWIVLLLLNTRGNEANVNGIEILLDTVLASMLISESQVGRRIAALTTVLTIVITILPLSGGVEISLLIGSAALAVLLLKIFSDDISNYETPVPMADNCVVWKARNIFNPFERYSYSPDGGIHIRTGILRRCYSRILTANVTAEVTQSIWQRMLGLSNVTFKNNFNGEKFGNKDIKNIRLKTAHELIKWL